MRIFKSRPWSRASNIDLGNGHEAQSVMVAPVNLKLTPQSPVIVDTCNFKNKEAVITTPDGACQLFVYGSCAKAVINPSYDANDDNQSYYIPEEPANWIFMGEVDIRQPNVPIMFPEHIVQGLESSRFVKIDRKRGAFPTIQFCAVS